MEILILAKSHGLGTDTYANAIKKKWYTTINGRQYMLRIPTVFYTSKISDENQNYFATTAYGTYWINAGPGSGYRINYNGEIESNYTMDYIIPCLIYPLI